MSTRPWRRRWRGSVAVACLGIGSLAAYASIAAAHTGGSTGYASVLVSGNAVRYSLTLSPAALSPELRDEIRLARAGRAASREKLLGLIRAKLKLRTAGGGCEAGPGFVESLSLEVESVTLVVDFVCALPMRELVIRDDIFDVLGPDHHTLAKIESPRATEQFAFAPDAREARVTLGDDGEVGRGSVSFFLLGVHHILSGYDHLLFLLGLILRGGRMLSLFKIITAFTVAHSVTLALAVLDVVVLPDRLVEAVIALSIALVAADNLSPRPAVPRRWVVSFLFGLVHGFGFSAGLRELGLPRQGLVLSLLGFNLGVEAGQALVIALVLPGLVLLRQTRWEARMVASSSLAILVIGLVLFVERVFL